MVSVDRSRIGEVCQLLAEALKDDPLSIYFFPDETTREENLTKMFLPEIRYCFRHGLVYGEIYGDEMAGVAVWLTPESKPRTTFMLIGNGGLGLLFKLPIETLYRMARYDRFSTGIHGKISPFPHWYLHIIAVRGRHRGKGIASRLLRPILAELDRKGLPCYLETQNPANVALYEHFGFQVKDESEIPGTGGTRNWAMLRMPISGLGNSY